MILSHNSLTWFFLNLFYHWPSFYSRLKMEASKNYSCSICNEGFDTKSDRDNHMRQICQSFIKLTDLDGNIKRIERIDKKFKCPNCGTGFNRSNHLQTHWKKCQRSVTNKSNNNYDVLTNYFSTIRLWKCSY